MNLRILSFAFLVIAGLSAKAGTQVNLICSGNSNLKHRLTLTSVGPYHHSYDTSGSIEDLQDAPYRKRIGDVACANSLKELSTKNGKVYCHVYWEEEPVNKYGNPTAMWIKRVGNQITMETEAGRRRWGVPAKPITLKSNCVFK